MQELLRVLHREAANSRRRMEALAFLICAWIFFLAVIQVIRYIAPILSVLRVLPLHGDALDFFIVGRGILNGLTPYLHLYEMKPPGIFLLSAMALQFGWNEVFAVVWYGVSLLLLPALLALTAVFRWREIGWVARLVLVASSLAFGFCISIVVFQNAEPGLPEVYAVVPSILYAIVATASGRQVSTRTVLFAALWMGLSVLLRETLFPVILAIALVSAHDVRSFVRLFVLPCGIVLGLGAIVFGALGWLGPFLFIHLPVVLTHRISQSPWIVSFSVFPSLFDNPAFNVVPFFGDVMGFLVVASCFFLPSLRGRHARHSRDILLLLAACFLFRRIIWSSFIAFMQFEPLLPAACFCILTAILLWIIMKLQWPWVFEYQVTPHTVLRFILQVILPLYLVTVGAWAAGWPYLNHYLVILPYASALFLLFLAWIARHPSSLPLQGVFLWILSFALLQLGSSSKRVEMLRAQSANNSIVNARVIQQYNGLLSACGITKILIPGSALLLGAFSRISPIGPIFYKTPFFSDADPLVRKTYQEGFPKAQMLITSTSYGQIVELAKVQSYIKKFHFTERPPRCAAPYVPLPGYAVLFKEGWSPARL